MNRTIHLMLTVAGVGLAALLLALTVGAQAPARANGGLIKVPDDYPTIQAAIDAAAEGDEIWIAKGVYTENLSIDKGIALYGGWNASFTRQIPGSTAVDGNNAGRVISITCVSSDTVVTIDGFAIMNGDATGLGLPAVPEPPASDPEPERAEAVPATQGPDPRTPSERAAELRARLAARGLYPGGAPAYGAMLARLERLTARAEEARAHAAAAPPQAPSIQSAGTGGGIYSQNASLQLLNCIIVGNVASRDGVGAGGGVFVADAPPSGVRIANNDVSENAACLQGDGWGGGLYVVNAPGAIIGNNIVEANVAGDEGNGYGGGLYVYQSPGVVVQDNEFQQNLGSNGGYFSDGVGGGLGVESSPDAQVRHNLMERNTANAAWNSLRGVGGGLFVTYCDGAVVRDNQVRENLAVLRGQGRGGGVQFVWSNEALVADNEVTGNLAGLICWDAQGGGIKAAAVYSTTLSGNEVRENAACMYGDIPGSFGHFGGGVLGVAYDNSRLTDNLITANATCTYCGEAGGFGGGAFIGTSDDAVAAGNTIADNAGALVEGIGAGGGLHLRDTTGSQVLRNRIQRNRAGMADGSWGGGLVLDRLEGTTAQANVDGNLILDNRASGEPTAASNDGGCSVAEMLGGFSFTNNVVAGNQAASVGGVSLVYLQWGGTVANNTIAGNSGIGLQALESASLTLVNNIVVSHTVGISVTAGTRATVRYTLWHGNGTDIGGAGVISHTHPVTGTPGFVDAAAGDYHLTLASAARDAGDPAGLPPAPGYDADGISRPQGSDVDLGAYEWRGHWLHLPLVPDRYTPAIGWAVGSVVDGYGTIIHTRDGGQTWMRQGTPQQIPDVALQNVSASDAEHAWAVGPEGVIVHTADGGRSWQRQQVPADVSEVELDGIYAVDRNTAWAVGWQGVILHTTDGGQTWTRQGQGMVPAVQLGGVYASDAQHAWAVGEAEPGNRYGTIVRTVDGGATWEQRPYTLARELAGYWLISIHGLDANTVWAVGHDLVLYSADGGLTWIDLEAPSGGLDVNTVFAVDRDTVWVAGDAGIILRSDQGGAVGSWQQQPSATGAYIMRLSAVGEESAWAVGQVQYPPFSGPVLHTADGGQVWISQTLPVQANWIGVSFVR